MAYSKGRKVIITHGLFKGRKATVLSHRQKGSLLLYELEVEGHSWPYVIRGSYLRAAKPTPRQGGKAIAKKPIKKPVKAKPKGWKRLLGL